MLEHGYTIGQVTLAELNAKLESRAKKFTPDHIAGIQTRLQILGTDQGPAVLNPANYKGLRKLRVTLCLGRAREKIAVTLPQKSQQVREAVEIALTAVQTYQGVVKLKAEGYLPEAALEEFHGIVKEAVGRVYGGAIFFSETQSSQDLQPVAQSQPVKHGSERGPVNNLRLQVLQILDQLRAGSNPWKLLETISRQAGGLTRNELLDLLFAGDSGKANQLTAAISRVNGQIGAKGITIISQRGPDGIRSSLPGRTEVDIVVVPDQDTQKSSELVEYPGLVTAPEGPEVDDFSANLSKPIEYYRAKRAKWLAGKPIKRKIVPNLRRHPLPSGFKEVVPGVIKLPLTLDKLPWLKEGNRGTDNGNTDQYTVSLALVTLSDTGNRQFYLGSYIHHPVLLEAALALKEDQSNSVNQLYYSCLPDIVRSDYSPRVKMVKNPRGGVNIYSTGNKAGQRVYFMRFDSINGLTVLVKVAVCDKERQDLVFSVLTTRDRKEIKKLGKLN